MLLSASRNILEVMDYAKIADIVCPILSVQDVNLEKFKADPHAYGGAFDELGLSTISILRSQGLGTTIPIIQDLDKISQIGKRKEVKDMYNLFMKSEFSESQKVVTLESPNDLLLLMLDIKNAVPTRLETFADRGSFLVEGIEFGADGNHVDVWGVVRGDGFSSAEHVHLTGFGDLEIIGIGSAFSAQTLEAGRKVREERAEEMEAEELKRQDKKKSAKRRNDFVTFKAAENAEPFLMKCSNFDSHKMTVENGGDDEADVDMKKLIEGFKDMGIGAEAPKDTEAIEDEIEDQEDDGGEGSYEELEAGVRPIRYE